MMFNEKIETAHILIVNDIDEALNSLLPFYSKHNIRVIKNEEKEEFQLAQATATIKEAYISSNEKKYIFLCGKVFRKEAQNSLLKILEEPPSNIVFIIITNSNLRFYQQFFQECPIKFLEKLKRKKNLV